MCLYLVSTISNYFEPPVNGREYQFETLRETHF